jgi:three-Cys-motif partner protein
MPKKHYLWRAGEKLPEIGHHSLAKHDVFARYIDRYIRILSAHPAKSDLNLTVIDGFCGGGKYLFGGQIVDGSPFVLLKAVRATEAAIAITRRKNGFKVKADFFFVDKAKEHISFLDDELRKSEYREQIGRNIHLVNATFEHHAQAIIDAIQSKGRSNRALFFLDQYGWSDVSFNVIRSIFNQLRNPEVILTFSVDSLIDYFRMEATKQRSGRAIELNDEFAELIVGIKTEQGARYLIQNVLYRHIRERTGAQFYTPFFVKSSSGHRSYWLLHLSRHERARDEMARLHWDMSNTFIHHGKAGFNALGFDPHVDPDQCSLAFDFGSDAKADSLNSAIEQLPRLIRDDVPDGAPVTIADLFRARCNDTPLTLPLVSEAVVKLRDDLEEVEIFTADGRRRPSAVNLGWNDQVRLRPQRTFLRAMTIGGQT